jgi:hypothetical protein
MVINAASATPSTSRVATIAARLFRKSGSIPATPYSRQAAISGLRRPTRSINRPAKGPSNAIISAGAVTISGTNNHASGAAAK